MNLDVEYKEFALNVKLDETQDTSVRILHGFICWLLYRKRYFVIEDMQKWAKEKGFMKR